VATFESLGLYWSPGDGSDTNICNVKYRVNGTSDWSNGLPLWFDTRNGEYRGSLVHLEPGTDYEIEMELQTTLTKITFFATTWNETFPIAQTVIVQDMSSTLSITQSGTKDGYILYTHAKGQSATIDVADNQDYCVDVEASYVIIRNLTLKNASMHAVEVYPGYNDVVIERCDISGWGRIDTDGWGVDHDAAVHATVGVVVDGEEAVVGVGDPARPTQGRAAEAEVDAPDRLADAHAIAVEVEDQRVAAAPFLDERASPLSVPHALT